VNELVLAEAVNLLLAAAAANNKYYVLRREYNKRSNLAFQKPKESRTTKG
jgi:hypothetical protein